MRTQRIFILMCLFLFIYSALLLRVGYYQVVRGLQIAREAVAMRSRQVELQEFSRGDILDRNLVPLTGTRSSTALYCLPREIIKAYSSPDGETESAQEAFSLVAKLLGEAISDRSALQIKQQLAGAYLKGDSFVRIATDLKPAEVKKINSYGLSGVIVAPITKRYGEHPLCTHIMGYVNGDGQGASGVELLYNNILKQNPSFQLLTSVQDAKGKAIEGLMFKIRQEQRKNNNTVVLTIDKRVQTIVEASMDKQVARGAVVVMDVHSKEILAMASRPAFNPYEISQTALNGSPFLNRATTAYHPGSMFKILVSAAALEEGMVDRKTQFTCTGEHVFNQDVTIKCWKEEGHGELDIAHAFAYSCNPSFIQIALQTGRQNIIDYAEKFHLQDDTIIGYRAESGSYIDIDYGEPALGNACLGQQGIRLSPLQIASLIATIADDGRWTPPALVQYSIDKNGNKHYPAKPSKVRVVSKATAHQIQQFMRLTVSEGTGKNAALQEVKAAGKTATSQTGKYIDGKEILNVWFGGFYPADNPRWVIVVMVEEGESGAASAAPVFKYIVKEMLDLFPISI